MFEYMKKYNYMANKESKPDGFGGYDGYWSNSQIVQNWSK